MNGSSRLVQILSILVGSAPGASIGLMFMFFGLLGTLVVKAGFSYRVVREIETILPDYDGLSEVPNGEGDWASIP